MNAMGISSKQKMTVTVLLSAALLVVLNQTLLSPALPSIMEHMSVDATTVQWITSIYALTEAVVIPLSAWFMGRVRTRPLVCGCMTLFTAGTVVCAIAPVFGVILLGRVMQATSTGILMTTQMAIILITFPKEKRGAAMGLVSLVIGFAPAVGPSLGGLLVDAVGWRMLFVVVAVASALVLAFAAWKLPDGGEFPRSRFDTLSVVLSSLGLVTLLYGLSSFTTEGMLPVSLACIAVGIVFVGFFARRQLKLEEPMLRVEILRSRKYRTAVIVLVLFQALVIGSGVLLPLYVQNVLGWSATVSGLVVMPGAVVGAVMSLISGRLFDRFGVRGIGCIGAAMLVVSGAAMCLYTTVSPIWFVIAVNTLFFTSVQLLTTPINTWGVNSLENKVVQHATAVTNTLNQVGGSLGTALIMSFTALGTSFAAAGATEIETLFAGYFLSFAVVAILIAIVAVVIVLFVRERKGEQGAKTQAATQTEGQAQD